MYEIKYKHKTLERAYYRGVAHGLELVISEFESEPDQALVKARFALMLTKAFLSSLENEEVKDD